MQSYDRPQAFAEARPEENWNPQKNLVLIEAAENPKGARILADQEETLTPTVALIISSRKIWT